MIILIIVIMSFEIVLIIELIVIEIILRLKCSKNKQTEKYG
jgi:heme/copper-type cytochrome/quinol oxidase subunit 2